MKQEEPEIFTLSRTRKIKGTRRLAREKVLQVLTAHVVSGTMWGEIFTHVFNRKFNFGDEEEKPTKLLRPDEIMELEADIPIEWDQEEIEFGHFLIRYTLDNAAQIDKMISEIAENWELDRIALIDKLLMQMATTEFLKFPEIPPKVSINEAIDIAKKYSTDKSSTFINGVLDSVLNKLKEKGLLNKTGRGLKES